MAITCLNCGQTVSQNFCPNCGQKKETGKLTWSALGYEILHFFSNVEKGFLKTSGQLLIRPGSVVRGYLEGQRKKYYKPLSLYLIWAAMRILTFKLVSGLMSYENLRTGNFLFGSREAGIYIVHNIQVFGLLLVPIIALFTWLIFSRAKMNYVEALAATIYVSAALEMLIIFQIVCIGLLFQINFLTDGFVLQVVVIEIAWIFFCLIDLFKNQEIKFLILKSLLVPVIAIYAFQFVTGFIADIILNLGR